MKTVRAISLAIPPVPAKAHTELDRAVDRCYRREPFPSDRARVEFLFQLYEKLTAPLTATAVARAWARRFGSIPPSAPARR